MVDDNDTKSPILDELKEQMRTKKEKRKKQEELAKKSEPPVRVPESVPVSPKKTVKKIIRSKQPSEEPLQQHSEEPSQDTPPPQGTAYGRVISPTLMGQVQPTRPKSPTPPVIKYIPTPYSEHPLPHPSLSLTPASRVPSKVVIPPKSKPSPEAIKKRIGELNHSIYTYRRNQQLLDKLGDPFAMETELEDMFERLDQSPITFGYIVNPEKINQLKDLIANVLYLIKEDTGDSREKYYSRDKFLKHILVPFAKEKGHDIGYYAESNIMNRIVEAYEEQNENVLDMLSGNYDFTPKDFEIWEKFEENPLEAIRQCATYLQDESIELTSLFEYGFELIIKFYDSLIQETQEKIDELIQS